MPLKPFFFADLVKLARIQAIDEKYAQRRIQQELSSLHKLIQQQESYLNHYDQLFRYISLWLLHAGYDLSNEQPHQVLKAVCLAHCPHLQIEQIIQQRHLLKKGHTAHTDQKLYVQLKQCVGYFQQQTQAYKN